MIIEPGLVPFFVALAVLGALFVLELAALLLGWSLLVEPDAADGVALAAPPEFDIEPDLPDFEAQVDTAFDTFEAADSGGLAETGPETLLDLNERYRAPFIIRLAAFCAFFGLAGLGLQTVVQSLTGWMLSPLLASLLLVPVGWFGARKTSRLIMRVLPNTETSATRLQFMGGLRGVVTQGTARRGSAAEIRLRDRHGNTHYLRCEPLRAEDVISKGTEVLTVRRRIPHADRLRADGKDDWALAILPLGADR